MNESPKSGSVKSAVVVSGRRDLELLGSVSWRGGLGVGADDGSGVVAGVVPGFGRPWVRRGGG